MRRPTALLAAALLAACAAPPQFHHYVLQATGRPADARGGEVVQVAITQVSIPDLVDRPQLVLHVAPHRVELAELHRWGEPLRDGVPRVLAADLERRLGAGYAVSAEPRPGVEERIAVAVHLRRFDAIAGKEVVVRADWSVRGPDGRTRPGQSHLTEPLQGAGHEAIVAAYSRALDQLAGDIAKAVIGDR